MKILVVDDEVVSRRTIEVALKNLGHEVILTTNGLEAWEQFNREPVPLVICDWLMPDMDGLQLCRLIRNREATPYVYFILLTMQKAGGDNSQLAKEAGVNDFITKPLDRSTLWVRMKVAEKVLLAHTTS